jgi:ribosome-associated heat shock protein Hsp15
MAESPTPGPAASVRIDRWLCAARIYKSRTQAQQACEGGHVKINGVSVRQSHAVKVGDRVTAHAPRGPMILDVLGLQEKRQPPARASELYRDLSPPPPPRDEFVAARARGAGRPTKAERRAIERLRRNG